MANMRRARKAVAREAAFRDAVSSAAFEMEEPLREAQHFIHVLGAISQDHGEDNEAISTVAVEANRKLDAVDKHLHRLFAIFRRSP
jgi:hypothetical protein